MNTLQNNMTTIPEPAQNATPKNKPYRWRRILLWSIVALVILAMLSALGFVAWASTPLGPSADALNALTSDELVTVQTGKWLTFAPTQTEPTTGLILYPGGRVDYRSYAPIARQIAEAGYLVLIPKMPLNLAVTAPHTASTIMQAHPQIEHWAVGGHSLGGAMAARFAYDNPDKVEGLALWAAYPVASDDMSNYGLKAVSISGSQDGLATPADIDASRPLLPLTTDWVAIEGGNHAQFGAYGEQPGDGIPTVSASEQQRMIAEATIHLLDSITQ